MLEKKKKINMAATIKCLSGVCIIHTLHSIVQVYPHMWMYLGDVPQHNTQIFKYDTVVNNLRHATLHYSALRKHISSMSFLQPSARGWNECRVKRVKLNYWLT